MPDEPLVTLLKQRKRITLRKKDEDPARAWADYYLCLWDEDGNYRHTGFRADQLEALLLILSDGALHPDSYLLLFAKDYLQQLREGGDPRREFRYAHGDPLMLSVSDLFHWVTSNPAKQKQRVRALIDSVVDQSEPKSRLFKTAEGHHTDDPVQILRLGFDREYQRVCEAVNVFIRWMIDSMEWPPFEEIAVMRGYADTSEDDESSELNIEFDPEDSDDED